MSYKQYSKYMNERMQETVAGKKAFDDYNNTKNRIKSFPKKVVRLAGQKAKKLMTDAGYMLFK